MAFWATCSKNMLICFKVSMEWPETWTGWNLENYVFFIVKRKTPFCDLS